MLTFTNVTKSYSGRTVLNIPSLIIQPGIHYFQGGNGSGKTTLFRTCAGLLPFAGQILLDNQYEISRDPVAYRLRVNYAEAEPLYPGFLTPRDLTYFVGETKRAPDGQIDELSEVFGVDQFWTAPTSTFSSGMLKKLALLLAFLGRPRVILLDEPLTTLDRATAGRLFDLIRRYRAEQNVTFLLTSHQDVTLSGLPLTGVWQVGGGSISAVG
ncbi:ABC transporter ATP-binding protein [Fibrisoma limi]|uniref:ABC transporter ATP-binding protein n=1 Tax=Fibrisoma limi TaxID=663275 RepID=UPI0003190B3C|nr:ATP-binding cassette domain-containing protein [Fibrisoma limi]